MTEDDERQEGESALEVMARRVERPTLEDIALWKFATHEDPSDSFERRFRDGRRRFESYAAPLTRSGGAG